VTLRSGHGKGAGRPHIEVLPPNELPDPVPPAEAPPTVPLVFRPNGKIADSSTARALGAKGGRVTQARTRLVAALGLAKLDENAAFAPYRRAGDAFVEQHLAALALQSGGEVGPAPATIVCSAGLQLAASRFLSDKGMQSGDAKLLQQASSLANDSRQNLLAAYELAVREAKARHEAHLRGQVSTLRRAKS
jgi:hypothetical protein